MRVTSKSGPLPLVVLSIGLLSTPLFAAEPAAAPEPATPHASAAPAAPTLYDIVGELAHADALQREIAATLRDTAELTALTAPLEASPLAPQLQTFVEERDAVTRVRYMELRAIDVPLRERIRTVGDAATALGHLAQRVVADLDRLDREIALWPQRSTLARENGAPADVQRSIDAMGPGLAALRERLVARRDQLLVAYEHAVRQRSQLDSLRSDVAERRERLWAALRTSVGAPIWHPGAIGLPLEELRADTQLMRYELLDYLRQFGERIAALFLVLVTFAFLLLRRSVAATRERSARPGLSVAVAACGALSVAIAFTNLFAPSPVPFVFYRLVWFLFPLPTAVVATRSFARTIPPTVWTLALALFLNEFRAIAEMSPAVDWGLLVLQVVPLGTALVVDWRRGALRAFFPHWRAVPLRRLFQAELAMLAAAVVASFVGYVGLALALVALAVIAPGYVLVFSALAWTLDRALASLVAIPLAQTLRSLREQPDTVLRTLHWIVVIAASAGGVVTFALSYSALDDVLRIGTFIANTSVTVGDVTITLKAILAAVVVIVLTWVVTKLVRFVLHYELLPRFRLRTGVPVAISTIVGYVLVVIGFVLAMAALGIDLTKVTLLAGAVGVGVGFGLQNVVNNFASGLILMLERPINVGDQIDVGGVVGEVKRIGVRSSTIRTFQGAEVIVPNSDLAGKQVTNWTLSDRARRYEIDVGVAYGSDPAKVLRLLEAAATSVPEVQKKPAPRALFTGFGQSSLDFRLYAWVESVDIGLEAQNSLRMAILKTLGNAGIEIPFPQQELRIRQLSAAAELTAVPRAVS
ncbi:MAG TPA: mechanosensitive ion channel domain-containing protein [Casimicrobiaceae bacterium]|nr:mechanosensitive ion channel domain-containing protein [Casimicrobiaceae bacterium]